MLFRHPGEFKWAKSLLQNFNKDSIKFKVKFNLKTWESSSLSHNFVFMKNCVLYSFFSSPLILPFTLSVIHSNYFNSYFSFLFTRIVLQNLQIASPPKTESGRTSKVIRDWKRCDKWAPFKALRKIPSFGWSTRSHPSWLLASALFSLLWVSCASFTGSHVPLIIL